MRFDFDEDQKSIRNDARRFLTDRCAADAVRDYLDGDQAEVSPLWHEISELGWLGVAIPEEFGGLGMGYLELCVLAEELGRVVAPVPFASSIYLAAEAILRFGSRAQKEKYLPVMASGQVIGTMAWADPQPGGESLHSAEPLQFLDGHLTGAKWPVPFGALADIVVLGVRNARGEVELVLAELSPSVDQSDATITRSPLGSVDPSQANAELDFYQHPAEILGDTAHGDQALDEILNRAAVMMSFEQLGGADRCREMAIEHVLQRSTFGRIVGSYQAVKHKLAMMYARNELARSNAYYGAWALSADSVELPIAASAARVSASESAEFATREALHLHGGMGYTWEVDCHLYLKRSRELALRLGSIRRWKEKLVAATLASTRDSETTPTWLANS